MALTSVQSKIANRMAGLITQADNIRASVIIESRQVGNWVSDRKKTETFRSYPEETSKIWQHNFTSLIAQVIDATSPHWQTAKNIINAGNLLYAVDEGRVFLIALKDDIERGLLDQLITQVQAEVTADYLGMAENLLAEGARGMHEHVPAAVLAGAVLERFLRELCGRMNPKISTNKPNGEPKTLNLFIDDLKSAGAYNELQAKQLRAWTAIRNAAAHGDFDTFTRSQVEQMIQGIPQFLATIS